jgi:hypothetical protein
VEPNNLADQVSYNVGGDVVCTANWSAHPV